MTNQTKNNNLHYLIDPTFTNVKRLFVLLFENENDRTYFSNYYVLNVQISFFWHANKKWRRNIRINYWNGKKQWLHDRQFIGLWMLFKALKINCNRFKQTNCIRKLWFKTKN